MRMPHVCGFGLKRWVWAISFFAVIVHCPASDAALYTCRKCLSRPVPLRGASGSLDSRLRSRILLRVPDSRTYSTHYFNSSGISVTSSGGISLSLKCERSSSGSIRCARSKGVLPPRLSLGTLLMCDIMRAISF